MSRTFQQTEETISPCAFLAACSGATVHTSGINLTMEEGGTPGSGNANITLPAGLTRAVLFIATKPNQPNATSWPAGDWIVPLNFTTKDKNMYLEEVHICRIGSDCSNKGSVGSATGLGIQLDHIGVQTITISGSAQTADATDRIYIIGVFRNAHASQPHATNIKADQVITTPL